MKDVVLVALFLIQFYKFSLVALISNRILSVYLPGFMIYDNIMILKLLIFGLFLFAFVICIFISDTIVSLSF